LKANFIYSDLNPCGGGERLTLVTMQAILEIGIDIELTTLEMPDITKIENSFGKDLASVINKIKKIHILKHILDEQSICNILKNKYDIIINTHGDIDPFYDKSFSKNNAITYCHYPSTKYFIESENIEYLEKHIKIARETSLSHNFASINSQNIVEFDKKKYLKWLKDRYDKMMCNSIILTNSLLLSAPSYTNDKRDDFILIISRIEPSKRIENAIELAKLLKEKGIGKGQIIVGSLEHRYNDYYIRLKKMILDFNLTDYVTLEINASLKTLLSLIKKSKVYFHPRSGEHFGMSIVEAMSAGLIPVVPGNGGQTEFVPLKYQYHTLEQAAQIISIAFKASDSERLMISNSVKKFSTLNYKRSFQQIVNELLVKISKR
jgi:glycosyltransferase involved in cell wall biosynthesis